MDVVLVQYPGEQAKRERLASEGTPRLLLVEESALAPCSHDPLEDWIRVPAVDVDVQARVSTLQWRARAVAATSPRLDADGVLRLAGSWVALPPVEGRLVRALLDRMGAVVSRDALARSGWPDGAPGRNALDLHVLRLRRRLAPVGLVIRTLYGRGYVIELDGERRQGQVHA